MAWRLHTFAQSSNFGCISPSSFTFQGLSLGGVVTGAQNASVSRISWSSNWTYHMFDYNNLAISLKIVNINRLWSAPTGLLGPGPASRPPRLLLSEVSY